MNKNIIIVVGPTAVGKTKYSIQIAKAFDGEIVSADSMQLYKYMDIGSAKPTASEQAEIKHYLVDEIHPRDKFSVAVYQKMAKDAINRIFDIGKTPVISGGTGLYVNSLIYEMDFSAPPDHEGYRQELECIAIEQGNLALHKLLEAKDKEAAERIHHNNVKKVIRALEILKETGDGTNVRPFEKSFVETGEYSYTLIGLDRNREELYERIDKRVDVLMEMGLLEEIKSLMKMGLDESDISMKGIGYKELIGCLKGEYDLDHGIYLVKRNSRHYAKRQLTWFRRYDNIKWFNLSSYKNDEEGIEDIVSWIQKNR